MPKLIFSDLELNRYFNGNVKHKSYNETVLTAMNLKIHAEGIYAKAMVEERRPNESKAVKDYREKIAKAITYPTWGKVITELHKIRRSAEWAVKYDDSLVPPRIIESETMKAYCESNYPFFTSVTNWLFSLCLPGYLKDPNAVIAVMPVEFAPAMANMNPLTVYSKPFGYWYESSQVIDFVQDDYAVIKSTDRVIYKQDNGTETYGNVYYIFTTQYVHRWEQVNGQLRYELKQEYYHNIGSLPVFKVKGMYKKSYEGTFIFESRLGAMLPRLDEALREYGDLQAEVVQNIYSEKWEIVDDDCPACKGNGVIRTAGFTGTDTHCTTCEGTGARPRTPYSTIQIKRGMEGDGKQMPIPPAGYVQKDTSIVKVQDERIDKHEYKALSAINMEYLAKTPLSESGTAKEVDRDALNTFVNSIAEDLVAAMDTLYHFICEYRYRVILPDVSARRDMLPYINVPEKFDMLSTAYLETKIKSAKDNKSNPLLIVAMEEDYINKAFAGDSKLKETLILSLRLDPLAGVGEDDKMTRLSNRGITLENYIVSCNVRDFINRAYDEKGEAFFLLSLKDQKELLMQYAKEQVEANTAAADVMSEFSSENSPAPAP